MYAKLAVVYDDEINMAASEELANKLAIPLLATSEIGRDTLTSFFLVYRDGSLKLLDKQLLKKGGLSVNIEPRQGEQHSWPAPKQGVFAQAIGKKTKTIVDATTGWAQDSLALFRMGYDLCCIERSAVMSELIEDGFQRLAHKPWVQNRGIRMPKLLTGNAVDILKSLPTKPDCIFLDPMFPPKRKKSALAKKSMMILRDILGDDEDREELFNAAFAAAAQRVVVKSPDYAEPLRVSPSQQFQGKLLRYDVYLKG